MWLTLWKLALVGRVDQFGMIATLASCPDLPKEAQNKPKNVNMGDFKDFLLLNMRLEPTTVKETVQDSKRFLKMSQGSVTYENVKRYFESYITKKAKTYNSQITSLRRLIRDYLKLPDVIMSFKMAPVDESHYNENLVSKEQVAKGFCGLTETREKALYLFTATTGLRKTEILRLLKSQVNLETHAVIPMHFTRKKRSGIAFYNEETAIWLNRYLNERRDKSDKLFMISERAWRDVWVKASNNAGAKITAKILRAWFSTEMGELGTPDRYVDIFQGRSPRSVLAKHYTGKNLELLKRIYDKANLKLEVQGNSMVHKMIQPKLSRAWTDTLCTKK